MNQFIFLNILNKYQENKYLNVLKDLIENGEERNDRITGTLAKFGETLELIKKWYYLC